MMMQFQCESLPRDTPSFADSKFQSYSTNTNLYLTDDSPLFTSPKDHSQNSQETPADLPKSSHSIDHIDAKDFLPIEREIVQITHRFGRIQQLLLQHSVRESYLHEKVYGFKEMPIDWTQLSPDLTNKISIVEDLRHLVTVAEQQPRTADIAEILESKFQEYYLERHYGGLRCEVNDLSIQERGEESLEPETVQEKQIDQSVVEQAQQPSYQQHPSYTRHLQGLSSVQRSQESGEYVNTKEDRKAPLSRIGGFASMVNESKLTYTEDCCQTAEDHYSISVEVPRFIEVEIPLIIYRVKERVITYDESDLEAPYKDIDEIIDKYSRPYQELYIDSSKHIKEEDEFARFHSLAHPTPTTLQVGSIMLDSNVDAVREMTEVELSYSQLPEEQLLLNSFAQIGSLISNSDNPTASPTIVITEKLNSRSILQKFQQSQRILNEENLELKEKVLQLQSELVQVEKKLKEATAMGRKLSDRLEEEIQQGVYLAKKLDELDVELLEEKVDCLTRLNDCKDSKIHSLQTELTHKSRDLETLQCQLEGVRVESEKMEKLLTQREEEMAQMYRQLEEREQELCDFNTCEDDIIKIVSETEISLKCEIEKLEQEKTEMKERLTEFQKRVESDGFNLQYEEAQEIQGIIESREHVFKVDLKEATDKYEEIIRTYKQELQDVTQELGEVRIELGETRQELEEAKQEVKILNELNQAKSELHDTCTTVKEKRLSDSYLNEFEAVIEEYDRQLEAKDAEVLQLKSQLMLTPNISEDDEQECLVKAFAIISELTKQLHQEREERMRVTARLVQVDKMLAYSGKALESDQLQKYEVLVEQLTEKLQKVFADNSNLKERMVEMKQPQAESQQLSNLRKQVQKLRKVNSKLKKYTVEMENELISISGMNRCESHKQIITSVIEERNYFVDMLTRA